MKRAVLVTIEHTGSQYMLEVLKRAGVITTFAHVDGSNVPVDEWREWIRGDQIVITTSRNWVDTLRSWVSRGKDVGRFLEQYDNWVSLVLPRAHFVVPVDSLARDSVLRNIGAALGADIPLDVEPRNVGGSNA